jgi:hypothetical protein
MDLTDITIELPLFETFLELEEEIRQQFPGEEFSEYNPLFGIRFDQPAKFRNGGYYCTPTNTVRFASTGQDGEHFSFLVLNNRVDSNSPVLFTSPCNYHADFNVVIAKDFQTFLSLGIRFGFFALSVFTYNPQEAMQVYATNDWEPTAEHHFVSYVFQEDPEAVVLDFIADSLKLQPHIYTIEEFNALQECYMSLLQMSDEYFELMDDE